MFLEQKKNSFSTKQQSPECDQCDFQAKCKVSLRKHIQKEQKSIPQLDGFLAECHVKFYDDKESQTSIETQETEVQTITNKESQTELSLENASLNENSPCPVCGELLEMMKYLFTTFPEGLDSQLFVMGYSDVLKKNGLQAAFAMSYRDTIRR